MRLPLAPFVLLAVAAGSLADPAAEKPELLRTLHEGSHFKPFTDKSAWQQRAAYGLAHVSWALRGTA